jgi:hypothetical protein
VLSEEMAMMTNE